MIIGNSKSELGTRIFLKTLPAQILYYAVNFICTSVTGFVISVTQSSASMSVFALCSPMFSIIMILGTVISSGSMILCGYNIGSGDVKGIKITKSTAIGMCIAFGVLFTLVTVFFSVPIAYAFGTKKFLITQASCYIKGIAVGIIPIIMNMQLYSFLQIKGKSKTIIKCTIIQSAISVSFILFVAFVLKSGMTGIALANSASAFVAMILLVIYLKKTDLQSFHITQDYSPRNIKTIVALGIPVAATPLMISIRGIFLNNMIMQYGGTQAAAAMTILASIWVFMDAVVYGTGNTVGIISSISYGESDKESVVHSFYTAVKYGGLLAIIVAIIYILSSSRVANSLSDDPIIISNAVVLICFYSLGGAVNILLMTLIGIYQGTEQKKLALWCNFFLQIVTPVISCLVFAPIWGITAIWASYLIAPILTVIIIPVAVKIINGIFPKNIEDIAVNEGMHFVYRLSESLFSKEDIAGFSERVAGWCLEHGITRQRSNQCGLFLEEVLVNIFDNAFVNYENTIFTEKQQIDVLLCIKQDDSINIRLRDTAPFYDVVSRANLYSKSKSLMLENPDIAIISGLSKELTFERIFDMNYLHVSL